MDNVYQEFALPIHGHRWLFYTHGWQKGALVRVTDHTIYEFVFEMRSHGRLWLGIRPYTYTGAKGLLYSWRVISEHAPLPTTVDEVYTIFARGGVQCSMAGSTPLFEEDFLEIKAWINDREIP